MRSRRGRVSPTVFRVTFLRVSLVFGLFWIIAGDVVAQRPPRRPVRPGGRPGMSRTLPGRNPAAPAPSAAVPGNPGASGGTSTPIKNLVDPNSPAPDLWKVKPDPPTEPPQAVTQDIVLRVPPSFFGGEVIYPTSPSVFVAVGRNGDRNDVREFWDLSARKKVGALRGEVKVEKPYALSSDGTLFAGKTAFDKTFSVFETRTGRMAAQLRVESPFADFVDFAGPGQIVTGLTGDRRFEVWDLKSQKSELEISPRDRVAKESVTLSPGRKYLAMIGSSTLWVYDLTSGRKAGEAAVPKNNNFDLACKALVFSPDGSELAGLFDSFGLHLLCWDVATGRLTHQFKYDEKSGIKTPLGFEGIALDWLADRAGWLLFGAVVIDHQSGQKTFTIPSDTPGADKGPRKIVGRNLVLITVGEAQNRLIRSYTLPSETIAAAARLIKEGGSAADAALPPLKLADRSSARKVTIAAGPTWSVKPDGSRLSGAQPRRPIPTQVPASEAIGLFVTGQEIHQAGLVSIAGGLSAFDPNQNEGKPRRLARFDTVSGKMLGRVELPALSDPVALSPDGARVLTVDRQDRRRLDVYSMSTPVHLAGWRPYDKEPSDNEKAVIWTDFLSPSQVLTVNSAGTLILWSIPDCKAEYVMDGACEGAPALCPGRRNLAVFSAGTFLHSTRPTLDCSGLYSQL